MRPKAVGLRPYAGILSQLEVACLVKLPIRPKHISEWVSGVRMASSS